MESTNSASGEFPSEREPDQGETVLPGETEQQDQAVDGDQGFEADLLEASRGSSEQDDNASVMSDPATLPPPLALRSSGRRLRWPAMISGLLVLAMIGGGVVLAATHGQQGSPAKILAKTATPTPVPTINLSSWCATSSATIPATEGKVSLSKVVALAANDAWLLGSTSSGTILNNQGRTQPLLEHWNGQAWSVVATADTSQLLKQLQGKIGGTPASEDISLNDLAVLSDSNIWAVGSIQVSRSGTQIDPLGQTVPTETRAGGPLIEHWDGASWQIVASPQGNAPSGQSPAENSLTGISASAANDIWALGTQIGPQSGGASITDVPGIGPVQSYSYGTVPLVEHWDGTSWTEQKLPAQYQRSGFFTSLSMQTVAPNDAWLSEQGLSFTSSVNIVPGSIPSFPANVTPGAFPVGGTVVVATAVVGKPVGNAAFHLLHWNGQKWSELQPPTSDGQKVSLSSTLVLSDNNIWALGIPSKQSNGTATIYHWDGNAWNTVVGATGLSIGFLASLAQVVPGQPWILGTSSQNQPLLERWNGSTWSQLAINTPAHGDVQELAIGGLHAWALVDQFANVKNMVGAVLDTTATLLETNC